MMKKQIDVNGLLYDGNEEFNMIQGKVNVMFTSDKIGETLSLTFDNKIQISVPFEQIRKMISEL